MTRPWTIITWTFIAFLAWLTYLNHDACSTLICPDGSRAYVPWRGSQCVCPVKP